MQQIRDKILNGFIRRVYKVRVEGAIDQKLTDNIAHSLQKTWPYRPTALLVTINSPGGSITQAKSINDLLKICSNRYNVPIVTFVEDQCLNSANLILTSGSKCYASDFSMIGDIGYTWSSLWFDKFAKKYEVKQQFVFTPENKVKNNPFEPMKEESEKWLQNYLYEKQYELKSGIISNREDSFLRKGLNKQSIEEKLFNAGILDPEEYVSLGLIDGLRSLDQQLKERYSSEKVKQVNPPKKTFGKKLSQSMLRGLPQ